MATSSSIVDSMADPSTSTAAPDPPPKCTICKSDLTIRDKQKTTKNYWKNCQSCRDKMKTAASNRKRLLTPASSTIDSTTNTSAKKQKKKLAKVVKPNVEFRRFPRTVPSKTTPRKNSIALSDESPSTRAFFDGLFGLDSGWSDPDAEGLIQHGSSNSELIGKIKNPSIEQRDIGKEKARTVIGKSANEPHNSTFTQQSNERECSSCADSVPVKGFPSLEGCDHDHDICQECFIQWLNQRMASEESVTCPSSGCTNTVTHADVRKHAPRDVFTR